MSIFRLRAVFGSCSPAILALFVGGLVGCGSALAQSASVKTSEETKPWVRHTDQVKMMGSDAFGDSVSLATGALAISQTDVSIPGNSSLPVSVTRKFSANNGSSGGGDMGLFGDWELDLPRLEATFADATSGSPASNIMWVVDDPTNPDVGSTQRCNKFGMPPHALSSSRRPRDTYFPEEFFSGVQLHLPGGGGGEVLKNTNNAGWNKASHPLVTTERSILRCLTSIQNGSGEGFEATTDNGTKYRFDWLIYRGEKSLTKPFGLTLLRTADGKPAYSEWSPGPGITWLDRVRGELYPTLVTDRFGHTVEYTWNPAAPRQLLKITARPPGVGQAAERTIVFTYYDYTNRIHTVKDRDGAGARTWTYRYTDTGILDSVTLPDNKVWTFNLEAIYRAEVRYTIAPTCGYGGSVLANPVTGTATHPSGATVSFALDSVNHTRTHLMWCPPEASSAAPITYATMSLMKKTVSGPGLLPQEWIYSYTSPPVCTLAALNTPPGTPGICNAQSVERKTVTVKSPDQNTTSYEFGTHAFLNDGKLLKTLYPDGSTQAVTYLDPANKAFPDPVGTSVVLRIDTDAATRLRPQEIKSEVRNGVTMTWQGANFDKFGSPKKVTRSSGLGFSKVEVLEYQDYEDVWVLGLVKTVRNALATGVIEQENIYDAVSKKVAERKIFGRSDATMNYYTSGVAQGLLKEHRDGASVLTKFNDYYRGVPRELVHADGRRELATVSEEGWIKSITDELSATTTYSLDNMGRLTGITQPTGDNVNWTPTVVSFEPQTSAIHGVPEGHWNQTVTTGNYRKQTLFDTLWRPLLTIEEDIAAPGSARFVKRSFDAEGRETFVSYPATSAADASKGITRAYDAFGRLTSEISDGVDTAGNDATHRTTIKYVENFKKRITNPRGKVTEIDFQLYDAASEELPVLIKTRESILPSAVTHTTTTINRDVWGKPTSITREGTTPAVTATRNYLYDANQRLCRMFEPERGTTIYDYDGANKLAWKAEGQTRNSPSVCNRNVVTPTAKVEHDYDGRGRLRYVFTTDAQGNTNYFEKRTYFDNSTLASLERPSLNGDRSIRFSYQYNKRGMPISQTSAVCAPGQLAASCTATSTNTYNALGHLASRVEINGFSLAYAPNALGQPTAVRSTAANGLPEYATNISYFPNGALKGFTYGNGFVHTLTQHPNQLPKTSRDAYSSTIEAVDDTYNYDENGNPVSITDGTPGSPATRSMGYDSLDRLTSANGIWGAANMSYDGLDNLLTYDVGSRRQKYLIGSDQLLQQVTKPNNGPVLLSFGYDARGNTTTRTVGAGVSTMSFTYDLRNQVLTATKDGVTVQRNQYDGYGRRTVNMRASNDFRYDLHDADGTRVWSGEFYPAEPALRESQTNYVYLGGSLIAKYVFKRVPGTSAQRAAGDGYQIISPFADPTCRDPMSGCDVLVGVGDGAGSSDDAAAAVTVVDTSEILFQHTDALGSPVAESKANRQITRTNYEPYGNPLNTPTTDNEPSYTGHQFDTTTGLIYAQARYYDPVIGRFLSIDPMAVSTGNAGNFNRYNYAANSPYKFVDPDGRCPAESTSKTCIAATIAPTTDRTAVVTNEIAGAAEAARRVVKLAPDSTNEKLASINRQSDGSLEVKLIPGATASKTRTAFKGSGEVPANAEAVMHGHHRASGLRDEKGKIGDADSLASVRRPNIAVAADGRMAAHEMENGTYQVRAIQGEFTQREVEHFQGQVDARQELLNEQD